MKDFAPYEQSLELKELGFNEPCFGLYHKDKTFYPTQCKSHEEYHGQVCSAPLYQQAFRFFREKHGLEIILRPDAINAPEKKLREYVILSYDKNWVLEPIAEPHWWIRKGLFKTYEEAELACLKKLIEIVKTKS
jgi:hypothetical protein